MKWMNRHWTGATLVAALALFGAGTVALAADTDKPTREDQPSTEKPSDRPGAGSTGSGRTGGTEESQNPSGAADTTATGTKTTDTKTTDTKTTRTETEALNRLHQANQDEIALGKLAQDKAESDQGKQLGKDLVNDHQDADKKVADFAKKHDIQLTDVQPDQHKLQKLQGLTGPDFDHQFGQMMVTSHTKAIDLVKKARSQTTDSEFRDLLDGILPKLQQHQSMAKAMSKAPSTMGRRPSTRQR
jgi:putative membrane protein